MAGPRHISVSEASRPVLPRHAKLKYDETRKVWVILAPERVLAPDEIAVEVLQLCNGERSVGDVSDQLAAKYAAPRDAGFALDYVKAHATTPEQRALVCNALIFKTNVLWVQLDALQHAYVEGHIPPGAFVPKAS